MRHPAPEPLKTLQLDQFEYPKGFINGHEFRRAKGRPRYKSTIRDIKVRRNIDRLLARYNKPTPKRDPDQLPLFEQYWNYDTFSWEIKAT